MILGAIVIPGTRLLGSGMVCERKKTWSPEVSSTPLTVSFDSGIPKVMASSKTLATEIVSSTDTELIFKMKQEYTPRVVHFSKPVNSLVSLTLDKEGKVKYHKDMWNDKDYSHEGLGKIMKTLNGDHLTKITRPPGDL